METPSDALHEQDLHALIAAHPDHDTPPEHGGLPADGSTHGVEKSPSLGPHSGDAAAGNAKQQAASRATFAELQLLDASTMALSVSDLDHAGDQFLSSGLTGDDVALSDLTKLQPEVLQWMDQCRAANGGIAASEDDVLYYFDTKYPELLQPDTSARTFGWLHTFLAALVTQDEPARFSNDVKAVALHTLAESPEATTALVVELGLKSTTTLQFWKFEQEKKRVAAAETSLARQQAAKRRPPFDHEKELVEWLLSHKHTPITNQDIVNHLQVQYPSFVEGRSSASLSVWVARFLKRHLPSEGSMTPGLSDHDDTGSASDGKDDATAGEDTEYDLEAAEADDSQPQKRRPKRKSPNGYVLHSNEFKLNALKMLDEGKTISEVAEELGIKCPNTIVYWNSIRDKLAVADKKRFRLAGGGRRSTCTFEDELMTWVSDRHQKGLGTDVKAVLDYLNESHPAFTAGKKEPTLRKWILRFFKRLRQPSVCTGAAADEDLDRADGILV